MISLNMRLTARPGEEHVLESAIVDKWIDAMAKQPGFVKAVMLKPYSAEARAPIGLPDPGFTFEVISFWKSEEERAAWAKRPIHNDVMQHVNDAVPLPEGKRGMLFTVEHSWNL